MRALFVSDIHISSAADPKFDLFLRFLHSCRDKKVDHLFLVGDIFDLWIADRDFFVSQYKDVVAVLQELRENGTEVHYFEGNHDLDLRMFWEKELGLNVYEAAAHFKLDDLDVRVEHGDQMDPDDKGYLFLRWLLRTPVVRLLGRKLPNAAVQWIGNRASAASREYTTEVKVATEDERRAKIHRHAREMYMVRAFDLFVSGHVHLHEDSTHAINDRTFRCFNLGTWLKEPLVLDVDTGAARLIPVSEFLA